MIYYKIDKVILWQVEKEYIIYILERFYTFSYFQKIFKIMYSFYNDDIFIKIDIYIKQ